MADIRQARKPHLLPNPALLLSPSYSVQRLQKIPAPIGASQILPISATTREPAFLVRARQPVWPVWEDSDVEALRSVAFLFGGSIAGVNAKYLERPLPGAPASMREWVVGFGEDSLEFAQLYAHLTGRSYRRADGVEALFTGGPPPTVVVTLLRNVTAPLLDRLYTATRDGDIPGIVAARTVTELRRQVLLRSAAACLHGPLALRSAEYYPLYPGKPIATLHRRTLMCGASSDEVRQMVSASAGLLTLLTHSDGIDAFAGPELTVCPMDRPNSGADGRPPYCLETGRCFRHGTTVREFARSDRLLSPDDFRCRVLLWATCYGVVCEDGVLDPVSSILHRFLENPNIGAIVTTWGPRMLNPRAISPLIDAVERGEPVGKGLRRANRSSLARKLGVQLCLFGDPRVSLPTVPPDDRSTLSPAPGVATRLPNRAEWDELAFLRAYLTHAAIHATGTIEELGRLALEEANVYEYMITHGVDVNAGVEPRASKLHAAVLRFLSRRGPVISIDWSALTARVNAQPRSPCPNCSLPATVVLHRLRVPGAGPRRTCLCSRCGLVEDAPWGSDLQFQLDHVGRAVLKGTLPHRRWTASLMLAAQDDHASTMISWPAAPDGAPEGAMTIPQEAWPAGAVKVCFVMLERTALTVLQAPGRRTAPLQ